MEQLRGDRDRELTIKTDFARQIPPLSEKEFQQLEENILADGRVINPIIVWKQPDTDAYVIVDGHNRYRIIQKHPEIPYDIFEKQFPDEYAVLAFIFKTQLGRRNLTPQQRKYLIGKQYNAEKASRGGERANPHDEKTGQFTANGQNVHLRSEETPRERIARENNTNERFVRRAGFFAEGVDAAEETAPGIKNEILSGAINPTDKAITAVAKSPPEEREDLVQQLREPPRKHTSGKLPKTSCEKETEENEEDVGEAEIAGPVTRLSHKENMDIEAADGEDAFAGPITRVSHREIMDIYDGLVHSEGITTEDDVIVDMQDAVDTLIFRWNKCLELNSEIAMAKTFQSRVREIAQEAMDFLHKF